MRDVLPNGTLVRVTDPASFYRGRSGVIKSSLDGRSAGGRVAYTVELEQQGSRVSFAATADDFAVEALPWESLAGLLGAADRCTCSDAQLRLVGCDCAAEQNLPVECRGEPSCGQFLRTRAEIERGTCRGCAEQARFEVRHGF